MKTGVSRLTLLYAIAGAVPLGGAPGEGAGDGGGAAGDVQPFVDVFQVAAHGALGDAQPTGDLGVGVPGRDEAKQFPVPDGDERVRQQDLLHVRLRQPGPQPTTP